MAAEDRALTFQCGSARDLDSENQALRDLLEVTRPRSLHRAPDYLFARDIAASVRPEPASPSRRSLGYAAANERHLRSLTIISSATIVRRHARDSPLASKLRQPSHRSALADALFDLGRSSSSRARESVRIARRASAARRPGARPVTSATTLSTASRESSSDRSSVRNTSSAIPRFIVTVRERRFARSPSSRNE